MAKINKVFRYFLTIEAQEYKKFSNWLYSQSPKHQDDLLCLWNFLVKNPEILTQEDYIDKKDFFEKLFFDKPYNESYLNKLMTDFIQAWKDYWKYKWIQKSPIGEIEFANYLSYDNLFIEDMSPVLALAEEQINASKELSIDKLYFYYLLRKTQIYSQIPNNPKAIKLMGQRLTESIETLDEFYFTAQLKHHLFFTLNSAKISLKKDNFLLETAELLQAVENKPFILAQNHLLNMYYLLLKTHFCPSSENADAILSLYKSEDFAKFSRNDKTQVTGIISAILQTIEIPNKKKVLIDFMIEEVKSKITFDKGKKGYIRTSRLYNMLKLGGQVYGHQWIRTFIREHEDSIEPIEKEMIIWLAKTLADFYECKYKEANKTLLYISDNRNLFLNIHYYTLRMKVNYKIVTTIGEDLMYEYINTIRSFQTFIENDVTTASNMKVKYVAFMKLLNKLIKVEAGQKAKLQKLKALCLQQKPEEVEWLLEEIELKIAEI